ncbi:MAG TPA: 23S rRNA (uracil(1939)-C(5))-methyltransferase RlmD [Pusillimonas sp.]|jgi:23S rRNA (uracil1939-C5)-methyltransferase|nr:23S rRNA (uracil(1939)-C(5))-methyltransferase RlmD [Pusillimonas sp.]MBC43511.1 23S rRNA (uracil(1939)-C(5))-methyltransferase RlmD [Pusillimonas sp.]HBT33622.1 23S rRNA (uracil(1939)-C(5))-methyltransferase RlmD [Pusillimonas sp.]|tara:strand:+ start:44818 stop:46152 length:1335 start_codon:yes stop_codon:yes gene_type:complete
MSEEILSIESLDLEARGVARREGKVVFVQGALPGERVQASIVRRKPSFDVAHTEKVLQASSQRVTPRCPNYGVCGGCAMQHLDAAAQVAIKQRALEDALWHIGRVRPARMLTPMHGPTWEYRYRARWSVRYVQKKGGVLVGFREKKGAYVADMHECHVLPRHVSNLITPLRELIGTLSIPRSIPQIEVAVGEDTVVLLMRHMESLSEQDLRLLTQFSDTHNVSWWLQPKGPDTVHPLKPEDADCLAYSLPEFGVRMRFRPTDFTQVNDAINRALVSRALSLLDIAPEHRVLDLFCGLGNFTLPLATRVTAVVGVEGSQTLVARANAAAREHALEDKTQFSVQNLFEVDSGWLEALGHFDRWLIDPPRDGAEAVVQSLACLEARFRPDRIVYVSCNPATLARDAGILVREAGYRLASAGAINMFPHTSHVESIAVFQREATPLAD